MRKSISIFLFLLSLSLFFNTCIFAQNDARVISEPVNSNERTAKSYVDEGIAYRMKGDNNNAIICFTKAIEIDPNYAEAYECRGLSYGSSQIGDFDKALLDFNKAIELNPKNPDFYFGRALTYFYKKNCYKCWLDIYKAERLGFIVPHEFRNELENTCGRLAQE